MKRERESEVNEPMEEGDTAAAAGGYFSTFGKRLRRTVFGGKTGFFGRAWSILFGAKEELEAQPEVVPEESVVSTEVEVAPAEEEAEEKLEGNTSAEGTTPLLLVAEGADPLVVEDDEETKKEHDNGAAGWECGGSLPISLAAEVLATETISCGRASVEEAEQPAIEKVARKHSEHEESVTVTFGEVISTRTQEELLPLPSLGMAC